MNRPPNRPKCKHGNAPGRCGECSTEQAEARKAIEPLYNLYWSNRGQNSGNLEHLLVRAYNMGRAECEKVKGGA